MRTIDGLSRRSKGRQVWAYELEGPGRIAMVDCAPPLPADLAPGEVLLRFVAGGICGSDVPKFTGTGALSWRDRPGPGFPLHEVVAEVVATASPVLPAGQCVVGVAPGAQGLREYFVGTDDHVCAVPPGMTPITAVAAQPLATVLSAADRAVDVRGRSVAVLGLGPLGLLLAHALKFRGARYVVGVDPVDRRAEAGHFGVDSVVVAPAEEWADGLVDADRPEICVEAVGHQTATLAAAVRATAFGGHVLAFGVADSDDYVLPFRTFFGKSLTMSSGTTQTKDWTRYLLAALDLLAERPLNGYATHVLPTAEAQRAYNLAATPARGRLKVVMTA